MRRTGDARSCSTCGCPAAGGSRVAQDPPAGEPLQFIFPKPGLGAVSAATVRGDGQVCGAWTAGSAKLQAPPPDAFDGKGRGVVNADTEMPPRPRPEPRSQRTGGAPIIEEIPGWAGSSRASPRCRSHARAAVLPAHRIKPIQSLFVRHRLPGSLISRQGLVGWPVATAALTLPP